MSYKAILRIGCFGAAIFLTMLAVMVQNTFEMRRYKYQLESGYMRSLREISAQLNTLTADLQKGGYAGTPAQLSAISAKVWKSADVAKTAFSSLPIEDMDLEETYRFLSQVGDYSMYLSRKSVSGQEITAGEQAALERLAEYSRRLNGEIADIEYRITTGELDMEAFLKQKSLTPGTETITVSLELDSHPLETYPTLIYDGPFSDHLMQKSPALTQGEAEVSRDAARKTAAAYMGISPEGLQLGTDEKSHMPSYIFFTRDAEIGVTRRGGHVTYLVSGREVGPRSLTVGEARRLAGDYLNARGLSGMEETYYELAQGVLTINYAYAMGDVLCYTDLIKVGVAMDKGEVIFYEARGFIANHKARRLPEQSMDSAEAAKSLSRNLTPEKARLALVPTGGGEEALAWEFRCKGKSDETVLVYVNAATGAEEQIFILIENENGTLAI